MRFTVCLIASGVFLAGCASSPAIETQPNPTEALGYSEAMAEIPGSIIGIGAQSCEEMLELLIRHETLDTGHGLVRTQDVVEIWMRGFLTAMNLSAIPRKYPMVNLSDQSDFLRLTKKYCEENRQDMYALAVAKLWYELATEQNIN